MGAPRDDNDEQAELRRGSCGKRGEHRMRTGMGREG